jgi:glycosyltransferase involved in cell wall biosynthesis
MKKLSAVIITLNEEKNIERCISSLQGVADEIVVLDSFSKDATKQICEKHGVKFFERAWEGYSASKNFANALASHNWILSIDADEALSPELAESIAKMKEADEEKVVYSFNRMTSYCGTWIKHCGWYPDCKVRIFNRLGVKWQGDVHETLVIPAGFRVKHLNGDLRHYSFQSKEELIEQTRKYALIGAKEKFRSGVSVSGWDKFTRSAFRFFRDFFLKTGFLQWPYGFTICRINAWGAYLKYRELERLSRMR